MSALLKFIAVVELLCGVGAAVFTVNIAFGLQSVLYFALLYGFGEVLALLQDIRGELAKQRAAQRQDTAVPSGGSVASAPAGTPGEPHTPTRKPGDPVTPIPDGVQMEICPACKRIQTAGRDHCRDCGAVFSRDSAPAQCAVTLPWKPGDTANPIPASDGDRECCPVCGHYQRAGRACCSSCGIPFARASTN